MKIRLDVTQELTTEMLKKIIQANVQDKHRLERLEEYYLGHTDVLKRYKEDETAPCNKIVAPYCKYITETFTGYFGGYPIEYKNQDTVVYDYVKDILKDNDSVEEDSQIIRDMSIFGRAYELFYFSDEKIRFKRVSPIEMIIVVDNTIDENMLYAIRTYNDTDYITDEDYTYIEVYSKSDVKRYKSGVLLDDITLIDEQAHYFEDVPVIEVLNNDYALSDFEEVMSLIDAYDSAVSDNLDNLDMFAQAYMVFLGDMDVSEDTLQRMKALRGFQLDKDCDVKFLTKDVNTTNIETTLTRLDNDILKFANCPNLSDENFSGNASGVALEMKFTGMEDVCSIKETKMRKFINKRLELIANISNTVGNAFDYKEFEVVFTRKLPVDESAIADDIVKYNGIVSKRTLLTQVPFVEDVDAELKLLEEDREQNAFYDYPTPTLEEQEEVDE